MTRLLRLFLSLSLLSTFAAAAVGAGWLAYRHLPLDVASDRTRVRIEKGMRLPAIGQRLRGAGIDVPDWQLRLAARLRGDARGIRFGVYEFTAPVSLSEVLDKLSRGDVLLSELTIVEGWTFQQMREAIGRHPDLLHDTATLSDLELMRRIGASEAAPEGLFFPDTYRFSPGDSDLELFLQSYRRMQRTLADAWQARASGLPLMTPYEALVLASIIEKETGQASDRERIAAVFVNRLRRGMPLQSDPTTIYGLGAQFDGNLRREHLRRDTPHNTYTRSGLPPTPIALAGRAALEAALHPADVAALYFVARGDGSSEFSEDLAAHNRAVQRFQVMQ